MLRKTLFAVSALLLAACAGTPHETASTGPSSCFRAEDVNGYNVIDREHVGVRVGVTAVTCSRPIGIPATSTGLRP